MVYRFNGLSRLLPCCCVLCGIAVDGRRDICPGCADDLPFHKPACRGCAMPLPSAAAELCPRCIGNPPLLAATVAAFRYEYPVAELIARFKFNADQSAGKLLAELLAERIATLPAAQQCDRVLVPIPLHDTRLRERGFNQALCLAKVLATRLRLPIRTNLLRKHRSVLDQKQLGATARRANLRDVFQAGPCRGLRIALVDDVITTGATADAAAAALLRNGASEVRLWCVARAI